MSDLWGEAGLNCYQSLSAYNWCSTQDQSLEETVTSVGKPNFAQKGLNVTCLCEQALVKWNFKGQAEGRNNLMMSEEGGFLCETVTHLPRKCMVFIYPLLLLLHHFSSSSSSSSSSSLLSPLLTGVSQPA